MDKPKRKKRIRASLSKLRQSATDQRHLANLKQEVEDEANRLQKRHLDRQKNTRIITDSDLERAAYIIQQGRCPNCKDPLCPLNRR